ncbi:hypothetical protein C8R44DRAFT_734927 [Mycena epipterygia]|nr:hypothetical protein C8R44DRAFT_734927 [Mycena epipterygia]
MTSLHPCVSNPCLKSLIQPWLQTKLKEFHILAADLPADYPYIVPKGNGGTLQSYQIPYFEFHGLGPPFNLDVGTGCTSTSAQGRMLSGETRGKAGNDGSISVTSSPGYINRLSTIRFSTIACG